MNLKETITSGKLCKMANISRKTLRWWVENGLIECEKNSSNGYYLFNINSLYDICDIKFLQKSGLSLEQIKNRENYERDFLYKLYSTKYDDLTEQIQALINAQKIVQKQIEILNRIKKEQANEITLEEPPFNYIEKLNILDEKLVDTRLNHNCVDVTYKSQNNVYCVGISSDKRLTNEPIWKKSDHSKFFKIILKQFNEKYPQKMLSIRRTVYLNQY